MGIPQGKKKMVVIANHFVFGSTWRTDNYNSGFSVGSIYLCYILRINLFCHSHYDLHWDKLQWESILLNFIWIPVFTGMTFYRGN